jgi:hypothetical protein
MPKPPRPTITSPCVADTHHAAGERIAEVSFPAGPGAGAGATPPGCLISMRWHGNRAVIEIYHADPEIQVIAPATAAPNAHGDPIELALSDRSRETAPLIREEVDRVQRLATNYARQYLADDGPADATDDAIRSTLAACALPPRPAMYALIRRSIDEIRAEDHEQAVIDAANAFDDGGDR